MCEEEEEWEDVGYIKLDPPITYSGHTITHVEDIDLLHINHGTLPNGGGYKEQARSDYTVEEVVEFVKLIDGIERHLPDWTGSDGEGLKYEHYDEDVSSPIARTIGIKHRLGINLYKDDEFSEDTLVVITLHDRKEG